MASADFKGKFSLIEKVDMTALHTIVDNFREVFDRMGKKIKLQGREDGVFKYIQDYKQAFSLIEEFLKVKERSNKVDYRFTSKLDYGRRFATGPSLQGTSRAIRHAISRNIYYDIDIKNAHPLFLYQLTKTLDFPHPVLETYVTGDREGFLQSLYGVKFTRKIEEDDSTIVMEEVVVDSREDAKALFLSILNGGGNGESGHEQLDKFYKQHQRFLTEFYKNPEFEKFKKRAETAYKSKKGEWDNRKGSALNYYLCKVENEVLVHIEEFLNSKKISYGTLCFDGLMVYRKDIKDIKSLLTELEVYLLDKTGYAITITEKEMNEDVDISDLKPKEEEEVEEKEIPEIDGTDDLEYNHMRVVSYCRTHETSCKNPTNLTTLRNNIFNYMDKFFATIESSKQFTLRETYHLVNGRKLKKSFLLMKDSWKEYCRDKTIVSKTLKEKDGRPIILFNMDLYLAHFERRKYNRLGFYPKVDGSYDFYNTFSGFHYVDDQQAIDEKSIAPFLDHIKSVWCHNNKNQYEYTLNYIAHLFQFPQKMTKVCFVLRSDGEGAGKGIILNMIGQIMGKFCEDTGVMGAFRQFTKSDAVFGKFNSMLEGACVIWLDEAMWAGSKKDYGQLLA